MLSRLGPVLTVVAFSLLSAAAHATHSQDVVQVKVYAPPRVHDDVRTLPMEEFAKARPRERTRVGGHAHRLHRNYALIGGYPTSLALKKMRRAGQLPVAVLADRRLTARERRRFREVTPLYDEADVMVVAAGHPACQGITRKQARDIVAGRIVDWSAIFPRLTQAISVRYRGSRSDADLRFGARYVRRKRGRREASYPAGSRGSADGGISAAAAGDRSVAAVLAWSRARRRSGVCPVPLDGVPPSDGAVRAGRYPESFRVSYVVPKRRIRFGAARRADEIVRSFMRSNLARAHLARRGLLVVGYTGPTGEPGGGPSGGTGGTGGSGGGGSSGGSGTAAPPPGTDHAGRPISPSPVGDAEQTLMEISLDSGPGEDGWRRFVFGEDGTLHGEGFDEEGNCTGSVTGRWTVKGAWRYPEYGGGLIARLGWFIGDPVDERVIDLPDAEPGTGYIDGAPFMRGPSGFACA